MNYSPFGIALLLLLVACDKVIQPDKPIPTQTRSFIRTPDERFRNLPEYPWSPNYVEINGLRMHYVEAGPATGKTVLLLHGQPSWSYLYRKMIPVLANAGYHVFAPDLIGFGKSDKLLKKEEYTISFHENQIKGFISQLGLTNIHCFIQDWGSIIGLRVISQLPDKFAKVAVGDATLQNNPTFTPNTSIRVDTISGSNKNPFYTAPYSPLYNPTPNLQLVLYPTWNQWRAWVAGVNPFYASVALQQMTYNDLPPGVLAAYDAPFPSEDYLAGARAFPFLAGTEPERDMAAWSVLVKFNKPFLTIYGDSDNIIGHTGIMFRSLVPGCVGQPHAVIRNTSHFLQEDNGELIAQRLVSWFN